MPNNSINQLKRAVQLAEQIDRLETELNQIIASAGGKASTAGSAVAKITAPKAAAPARKKGGMSAAGRARIAAAQKARWAKIKAGKSSGAPAAASKPKGRKTWKISAEARARMVAGAKARWAKIKAGKAPAPKRKSKG